MGVKRKITKSARVELSIEDAREVIFFYENQGK